MSDNLSLLYFGKAPSRGDFVRSSSHPALIQSLDRWLSSGIELMAEDAHWKQIYDQADASHFAMISPHRGTAVAGHIVPSADLSGRRFPFLTAAPIESESGRELMTLAPLMFQRAWDGLAAAAGKVRGANEQTAQDTLNELGQITVPSLLSAREAQLQYEQFLDATSMGTLQRDLELIRK